MFEATVIKLVRVATAEDRHLLLLLFEHGTGLVLDAGYLQSMPVVFPDLGTRIHVELEELDCAEGAAHARWMLILLMGYII